MIGDIRELSTDSMTQSELFRTYYATGLSWPTVPQYIDSMDTQMIRGYTDPAQAPCSISAWRCTAIPI